MMITAEYFTAFDGTTVHYRFLSAKHPRAVVIILHGLGEHSGRYEHVMEAFGSSGILSAAPDHRGHGKTAVVPGYLPDIWAAAEDVGTLAKMLTEAHPGLPVFLLGHSMGGLIALLTLLRHQKLFRGAVLSGAAAAVPDNVSPILKAASAVLSFLTPRLPVQDFDFDNTCRDRTIVEATKIDPLFYRGKVRARTGAELLRGIAAVRSSIGTLSLPLLVLHGEEDNSVPLEASHFIYQNTGSADKILKVYPELYHEILNEPEKQEVIDDIQLWIQAHTDHGIPDTERRHQTES